MAKRLKSYVHVHGDDGETHVFGPEDEVPEEFAEKIGDHAWVDADEPLPDNRPGVVVENPGNDGPPAKKAPARSSTKAPAKAAPRKAPAKQAAAKPPAQGGKADGGGGDGGESGSGSSSGD